MLVIRIGPRALACLGMTLTLAVGFLVGSLRPADLVFAAGRGAPAAAIVAAPDAQGAPPLTMEQATRAIQGAVAYAQENGYRMSFVVVDAAGTVVAAVKMDGTGPLTPTIVQGKAMASAAFGRPSGALAEGFTTNPALWYSVVGMGRGFVPAQGALPIEINGVRAGAMGGGGGTSQQDEDAVRAGLQAAGLQ
jgi:glc operon protein GlcG